MTKSIPYYKNRTSYKSLSIKNLTKPRGKTMKSLGTLEELETLKRNLLKKHLPENIFKEMEVLQGAINSLNGSNSHKIGVLKTSQTSSSSLQRDVVDAVLELIDVKGHRVTSREILDYFGEKSIFINDWEDKDSKLGAILWAENKKKTGRIKKVGRGLWDKRREKQASSTG